MIVQKYITDTIRYKELIYQLVLKDIKLKYRRSYLGYVWSILNPLLTMMVMVIVFSHLFRFDIPNFPVYLLTGQIIFGFLSESTSMAVGSITGNAPLLKKTYVPKYIFTLSKVTSSLVNLLFSLIALVLVIVITGAPLSLNILLFPVVILELYVFCMGVGLFLAASAVFFRDIQYLWGVFISIWMYLTPIFYPVTIIPEAYRWYYTHLNPMYGYIMQFRTIVLDGNPIPVELLGQGILFAFIALVLGVWSFTRRENEFILYI